METTWTIMSDIASTTVKFSGPSPNLRLERREHFLGTEQNLSRIMVSEQNKRFL